VTPQQRLAIDPNSNKILFFGARSGNGLWKSTDYGSTWAKVSSFTNTGKRYYMPFLRQLPTRYNRVAGSYIPDSTDSSGYNSDKIGTFLQGRVMRCFLMYINIGISWVTFDQTSGKSGSATPRIFVGVANKGSNNIFVTNDGGNTCEFIAIAF